jgi:hypothetical protein
MESVDDGTGGFHLFFASVLTVVFPSILSSGYINQNKFLVARGCHLVVSTNIPVNRMAGDCRGV